jgi:hypothetical protein
MAIPTWGMLAKSQTDPEKIEEAIARLIQQHNEDEEAHLGPGQSLQSHKAAEIIDHLASSIIADKIARFAISFDKFAGNKNFIFTTFDSLDGWDKGGVGAYDITCVLGGTRLVTGPLLNDTAYIRAIPIDGFGDPPNFDKNPVMQVLVRIMDKAYSDVHLHIGSDTFQAAGYDYAGFRLYNNKIYTTCRAVTVGVTTHELTNPPDTEDPHIYRIEVVGGVSAKFYIDGILVDTITENVPWGDNEAAVMFIGVKSNLGGGEQCIGVYHALYQQN